MAPWTLPAEWKPWIAKLAGWLHARNAHRLQPLFVGLLFAQGRRTVASWLRAAELGHDFRAYYYFLGSLGRKTNQVAVSVLQIALTVIVPGDRLLFGLDDTPTKRFGPQVEGAGIHHNPTPGPAGQKFLSGHVWVTLAWLVRHPRWGTIALPLLAFLYVRQKDLKRLPSWYRVVFQTKLEMAAALVQWLVTWLKHLGKTLWLVADGAYAKRPLLKAARQAGVVIVSRLRCDAALWSVPPTPRAGAPKRRGRPRLYGQEKLSLVKRAAHPRGWQTGTFTLYGHAVSKTYKSFLATYKPAGGLIHVVLVKEDQEWRAYFCTDPAATVRDLLEAVADRAAIEQAFHDLKEVHGAGQQQVRHYWASVAAYHLQLWWHTLIEVWAWDRPQRELCDRSARPWDDATRRPSHADRRNALRRQCLLQAFREDPTHGTLSRKLRRLVASTVKLVS